MKDTMREGIEYVHRYRVPENKTVPYIYPEAQVYQEMPKVFATGFMVALIEWACIEAMAPHMEPGHGSVGTLIHLTHSAATPPGMEVTVHVRCTQVDGQRTTTHWGAHDLLQSLDPALKVERELRVVDDGIISSAGVASGMDMAFYVIESLCGPDVANETAHFIEYRRA